jgi:hypothetical protein
MNSENELKKRKGGRPKKVIKKSEQLAVMCNLIERKIIEANANKLNISVSEYLREAGMKGQVVMKLKTLPKDVLLLTGTLNHIASSLNQIARKRNMNEELNALERAELNVLHTTLKQLAVEIKSAIQ